MVLRDRDVGTAWTGASDGTLEERRYLCQNWRADVSAIITEAGKMVERVKYSAYGVPFALPAGDSDADGDWDATDSAEITDGDAYRVAQDADVDGDLSFSDAGELDDDRTHHVANELIARDSDAGVGG